MMWMLEQMWWHLYLLKNLSPLPPPAVLTLVLQCNQERNWILGSITVALVYWASPVVLVEGLELALMSGVHLDEDVQMDKNDYLDTHLSSALAVYR